jgi:hypothetical protein
MLADGLRKGWMGRAAKNFETLVVHEALTGSPLCDDGFCSFQLSVASVQ